jgi:hypothetical protein
MWSIGCIMAEMYSGELLFGTHENQVGPILIEPLI